jgi:hypothetical protein
MEDTMTNRQMTEREKAGYERKWSHMPFMRDEVTPEQLDAWFASRKDAGRVINIEACEVTRDAVPVSNPYEAHPFGGPQVQEARMCCFARSAESNGWICEDDLPPEKRSALRDRLDDQDRKANEEFFAAQEAAYDRLTEQEKKDIEDFLAVRKEAGLKIDPETAEVDWAYGDGSNPYNAYPFEPYNVGRVYFARSPGSDIWVAFGDLPEATRDALWKKHSRRIAFPAGLEGLEQFIDRTGGDDGQPPF